MQLFSPLRAFHATARHASMSQAARQLSLTQPTVSAHIAHLEQAFQVELFHRRGRQLHLTDFGQSLLEITDRMFEAEVEAESLLRNASSRVTGILRISAVGPFHVTPILRCFRARWPDVRLVVDVGDSSHVLRQVLDYHADVGVLVHAAQDGRLHQVPLGVQPLVIFAAATHPLAGRAGLRMSDLQSHAFVIREQGSTTRRTFEAVARQAGITPQVALEVGSREAIHEAVAQGLGLGVVGRAAYIPDPRLTQLDVADFQACTYPHAICLRARQQARLVRRFLEMIRKGQDVSVPVPS